MNSEANSSEKIEGCKEVVRGIFGGFVLMYTFCNIKLWGREGSPESGRRKFFFTANGQWTSLVHLDKAAFC